MRLTPWVPQTDVCENTCITKCLERRFESSPHPLAQIPRGI
jgi:hypothetical protein